MRVAAYCRVSTDKNDQLNSLETQKGFFLDYAEKNNHELVRIYADEGISGTKIKKRVEFQKLLRDARLGLFDLVAVKDISRFARNTVDFLQSIRELKSLGINTVFLTANMTSMGDSEFVLTLFGALAQEESANTSKRIKFSKQINAEKGRVPNQVYGYDKIIGDFFHLDINPEEARWVEQIFDWYTEEGYGALKISQMLNAMGVKTKRGNLWSQVAINRLLRNAIYAGKIINGKQEVTDFLTGERKTKSAEEWYVVDRPELAIISQEQYDKAQQTVAGRHDAFQITKERQSNKYPLSTLIKCKDCGFSFRRYKATYTNTYVRWICSGRNRHGTGSCPNATKIDEAELLNEIDKGLKEIADNEKVIIEDIKNMKAEILSANMLAASKLEQLQLEVDTKKKKRKKVVALYMNDLIGEDDLNESLKKLDAEINEAEQEIKKESGFNQIPSVESAMETINTISKLSLSETKTNAQLKSVIEKIEVNQDGVVEIYYKNMPHNSKL